MDPYLVLVLPPSGYGFHPIRLGGTRVEMGSYCGVCGVDMQQVLAMLHLACIHTALTWYALRVCSVPSHSTISATRISVV